MRATVRISCTYGRVTGWRTLLWKIILWRRILLMGTSISCIYVSN